MSTDLVIETRVKDGSADTVTLTSRTFTYTEKREFQQIVNNGAEVLWDAAASGSLADFDLLVLSSDQPVQVEFLCVDEYMSVPLEKNVALVLGSDDAYKTFTTDVFAGTLDVISKVRVKELNSVNATVTLSLYT